MVDDFELVFNDFFGTLVAFFRFGVEPSSEPVNSTVLRRRLFAANFFARSFRLLIFFVRLEWQSFTWKSKSLSRSLSDSLGVISEKSSSLSASSSSDDRSPVFSVELLASSTLRLCVEFDVSRSNPLVGWDFDKIELRAFFLPVIDCTVDVVLVVLFNATDFDLLFFVSRFPPSANSFGFSPCGESAYVYVCNNDHLR